MGIISILSDLNDVKFNGFKGIPFWSWNNTLNEDELVKQIEQMKSAGLGGFIMHARTGLKDEYLGDKWFACIEACLKKAKELNMEAWLYDENGWPSGFAGGKLLKKDNYAQYFELQEKDYYDADCYCCFIESEDGSYKYVENTVEGATKYLCIYIKDAMAFVDVLNPRVVDEFISVTHEEYLKRFKDYFGNTLVGIFTDEPQYFRYKTPYSKTLEAVFEKEV